MCVYIYIYTYHTNNTNTKTTNNNNNDNNTKTAPQATLARAAAVPSSATKSGPPTDKFMITLQ